MSGGATEVNETQKWATSKKRLRTTGLCQRPNTASLCSADCREGINELRERYRKNADVNSRSDTRSKSGVSDADVTPALI
jgi:hypothetical protein